MSLTEPIPSLPMQAIWPSFILSGFMIVCWGDYCVGAMRAFARHRTAALQREFVVSFVMLLVTITLAVGIIAAWTPPPRYIDVVLVGVLAALRTILMIVGFWLVWDRRKRRSET